MARASVPTLLSLDRWAEIFGINPLSFNQLTSTLVDVGNCGEVWYQHAWQKTDRVGREDVAVAIKEAEDRLMATVGYPLLPIWIADERVRTERPARPELYASGSQNLRGQLKSITSRWGYVISGGQRQKDLIDADVAVTDAAVAVFDLDGDGYKETVRFTVDITNADVDSACEIHVYYPVSNDLVDIGGLDEWEVRPIKVSVAGNTATITFKRWQIVAAKALAILNADDIDSALEASYEGTVDVYRVWNDPQAIAELMWEYDQDPIGCSACGGAGCVSCSFRTQDGCFHVRDERLGILAYTPATWDADNNRYIRANYSVCRDPDQMRIWYYAGYRSDNPSIDCPRVQLDPFWERIIAEFSAGLLDREICDCNNIERYVDWLRDDFARVGRATDSFQISASDLDNPLGTTRGAVKAWRKISAPNTDWIVSR